MTMKRIILIVCIFALTACFSSKSESPKSLSDDIVTQQDESPKEKKEQNVADSNKKPDKKTEPQKDSKETAKQEPVIDANKEVEAVKEIQEPEKCEEHLFEIAKSDNANVLYYDIKMDKGKIVDKEPVNIYWIMYAEKGQTETMTFLEKPQFGIKKKTVEEGKKYIINVKNDQLSSKDIIVELDSKGCATARTLLNGEDVLLTEIYIYISPKSGILPTVEYIDLNGLNNKGEKITERILPK